MTRSVRERLLLLGRIGDQIATHPMVTSGQESGLTITFDAGGLRTESREPDEQLLHSLMLLLRPCLLNDDDAHLSTVLNLAIRHIDDPWRVHAIESAKYAYRQIRRSLGVRLVLNETEMTPERAADLWMNGVFFHHDAEKEAELMSHTTLASAMVRYLFLDFMHAVARVVVYTGNVIRQADSQGLIRDNPLPPAVAHPISGNGRP
jgi:hypothetical protein